MDLAIAFYRDVLDLALDYRAGNEWAQFSAGPLKIGLHGTGSAGESRVGGTLAFTVDRPRRLEGQARRAAA